ncbi:hypothetical protein ONZ43_g4650 [Nemania bipapillata]|uniref:Uncharacterized protein n=1 Tax=Nemania bipapillata TaxID=110536 RepID=A0ACC2IK70_9PEZI|nr:hypothetical protein ONZ43_g4650 [Nemania bipapillata]
MYWQTQYYTDMTSIFLVTAFLALAAAREAGDYGPETIDGASIDTTLDAYSVGLITNAQQHPNVTRGVTFKPFESVATLGVNVSDFAAPNAKSDYGSDAAVDPHIVTTSYDFNWSGSKYWPFRLNGTTSSYCFTVADSLTDLPANVTNAYTEEDTDSSSCVSTLGQACVDAILASGRFSGGANTSLCLGPSQVWSSFPACQSTLGYTNTVSHGFSLSTGGRTSSNNNNTNTTTNAFLNGGGWFGFTSGPQNGSGSNEYYTAMNRLHIAMVTAVIAPGDDLDAGYTQDPHLLCMRVNATKLSTKDTNGDGVTWTSEAVLESKGYSIQRTPAWASTFLAVPLISLMFAVMV